MNYRRQTYLDAANYMRKHGFSVEEGHDGGPRCFCGALASSHADIVYHELEAVIPILASCNWLSANTLAGEGWTKRDAIAALEIAADLAA